MDTIDIKEKLGLFADHWSPRIIAALNGQEVKLAKFIGAFEWHSHPDADELFYVLEGSFTMEFRDRHVDVLTGQMLVVPQGVEHRPRADKECAVLLVEPAGLVNTGDADPSDKSTKGQWI